MPTDTLISASILAADFGHLSDEISAAEAAGVDWIHIDVMDGQFVPNISMGPALIEASRRSTELPLDVHLMVADPDRMMTRFAGTGADSLTVHVEACTHLHRTLQQIKDAGLRAGVALNPATPVQVIEPVLDLLDLVLVMTVNPGYAGQAFLISMLPKIRIARALLDEAGSSAQLQVDGGIGPSNAAVVVEAGATVLAAASSIFNAPNGVEAGVQALRQSLQPSPA